MTETTDHVSTAAEASQRSSTLLSFLIADVRGYTAFTSEHGDEAAARLAARFADLTKEMVTARGGEVLELRGDEALAVFRSARDALKAAIALQDRFAQEVETDRSLPLQVGIGLDAGDAIPVHGGYRSGALNLAARLCSLAGPGEIFASEELIHLARKMEGLVYLDRGEVQLKGLVAPVRVIQIVPEGQVPTDLHPLQQILVTHPTNLPDEATPFIGREREIAALSSLLQRPRVRLVTLTGPGGTGKTRLALQVGASLLHQFADGVFFVSLGSITDPALVPSAIASTLRVGESGHGPLLQTLSDYLKDKHLLLVLDNFEHLLDACSLVSELLDACPRLAILVTSRTVLRLSREHDFEVPPLSLPDPEHLPDTQALSQYEAVALFIERAEAARADFTITKENAPVVAEICYRLDGLPLAIELAAARIRLFPPPALLGRLSSRLKLLTGGPRDLPARHQTLRGTIDWSYHLLNEAERPLFARLAVFVRGCTLEAAEAVCNARGDLQIEVLEGLGSLVDKSLLRVTDEGRGEPRFVMLETIREYALEQLEAAGELGSLRQEHARFVLATVEEAQQVLWGGPEQLRWLARLDEERDNIRAALAWARDGEELEIGLRLAVAMQPFWQIRGHLSEGRGWLTNLLTRAGGPSSRTVSGGIRAQALLAEANLTYEQGDLERAQTLHEEALHLSKELSNNELVASALLQLGSIAAQQGDVERATALHEEGLALGKELGDPSFQAWALAGMGGVAAQRGDFDQARSLHERGLQLYREVDNTWGVAHQLALLADAAFQQGDLDGAEALSEEALPLFRKLEVRTLVAQRIWMLGVVARARGDYGRAVGLFEESLAIARDLGQRDRIAMQLYGLALLMRELGDYARARALGEESLALFQEVGARWGIAMALLGLGDVARDLGDAERVTALCEQSLATFRELGQWVYAGFSLNNLGLAAWMQEDYRRATILLEESLALFRQHGLAGGVAEVLTSLGLVADEQGECRQAQASFAESLTLAQSAGPKQLIPVGLEGMAGLAVRQGQPQRAARLFGASEALRAAMGIPIWPVKRPLYERDISAARAALGDEDFAAAWEEGRAMPLEQAVASALAGSDAAPEA